MGNKIAERITRATSKTAPQDTNKSTARAQTDNAAIDVPVEISKERRLYI